METPMEREEQIYLDNQDRLENGVLIVGKPRTTQLNVGETRKRQSTK
jgi:hypothetical protein